MDKQKQDILKALIEKPTTYTIDVKDASMLPDDLKGKQTLKFTVKPPTLEVLSKCASIVMGIPEDIRESKDLNIDEAVRYRSEMAQVFSILAHGKQDDYPDWYVSFILNNVTAKELYMLFYESVLKLQTDFFLNSFQIASTSNPMMMNPKNDSTPTN
ncbi:hypothetical protein [Changchengzhania lutea]|uniref:hypothetical protein n=1 Tax=Changchengzhania lutea TaxID=2049305 RepID=UPI00115D0931|nr:hypothetical protein [Changchengzhania lutea]